MLLAKTASLPQLKVSLNKYENFFTKKSGRDAPLDEPEQEAAETETALPTDRRNRAHTRNLEIIDRKSTIRSKVESYLTDSRKMGILDHNTNETSHRRSLTRISLETMKPLHTSAEQLKRYLTQLKTELNQFFEKNQRADHEITNCQAMTSQVRERIIFYEQLAQKTWIHRYELLDQRHHNLEHIRYETDRLHFMQARLKDINILMRKRVKDAQNALKNAEGEARAANEQQAIKQDDLDNKLYLLKHYEDFEKGKSEKLGYKTDEAMRNMKQNEAAELLRRHHKSIAVMEYEDYRQQEHLADHTRLSSEVAVQQFTAKLLEATWTRCSTYYEEYEKAEQLMKMHALDRNALVQDSYKQSFEIKQDLQNKIKQKEEALAELQARNGQLRDKYTHSHFGEIEEIERRIADIKLEYITGKKLLKEKEANDQRAEAKTVVAREEEIERAKAVLSRLREWIKDKEKTFPLTVSKKQPLHDHFTLFIQLLARELKAHEPTYVLKPAEPVKKALPKPNKYGNLKKRK